MVDVELTLELLRALHLYTESPLNGWVVLSGMPIHHERLHRLSADQRRMWANARQIVPFSSRTSWERALARYRQDIPAAVRLYESPSENLGDAQLEHCRRDPLNDDLMRRTAEYNTILSSTLAFATRERRFTQPDKPYRVTVRTPDGVRVGRVRMTAEIHAKAEQKPPIWFDAPRKRKVIHVTLRDLLPTAEWLDQRERVLKKNGWNGREHWVHDLGQIRFRPVNIQDERMTLLAEETVESEGSQGLRIEGMTHLPGMVSAGKTTLAKLIIAHCLRLPEYTGVRITFVVGDSQTAIATAHQINTWFYDDPNGDEVKAVPVMGNSQRFIHWQRLTGSQEYQDCVNAGRPHWGERWLMPVCPIQPLIDWDGGGEVDIPIGNEPCEGFGSNTRSTTGKNGRGVRCLCPLTAICPSKRLYRDMPHAQVWITTPGALSQANVPLYWDNRLIKVGELVYEQSDLVILDEVETIVDWFDKTYARTEPLTNGKNGLLDRLDPLIAQYWISNRTLSADQRRWILAVRESVKAETAVLSAIADPEQTHTVKRWVGNRYFNPNQLAYRLARRLAGLKEWDSKNVPQNTKDAHNKRADDAFQPFNTLLNSSVDPLRRQTNDEPTPTDALARIMQAMNNLAEDVIDPSIFTQCQNWITQFHPDMGARLDALKRELKHADQPDHKDKAEDEKYLDQSFDRDVKDLARRLQFLLMVALLDRHIQIVIEEWHNKPDTLDIAPPFGTIPRGLRDILPLPITGRQYGFVIDTGSSTGQDNDAASRLSLFSYTNIGRSYLLNYHTLLTDFNGQTGAHVLALSGTSYLPDSTSFHVAIPPVGVLMPSKSVQEALPKSYFVWKPFYKRSRKQTPIFISGSSNKLEQLQNLIALMLKEGAVNGGFFKQVLDEIARCADDPDEGHLWANRGRILILTNSYEQAKLVARLLREGWREAANTIYELKRGDSQQDYEVEYEFKGELRRADIEGFAQKAGKILVAPMMSIGRGFNILNANKIAAFGAVFFLTRPMNPPHDKEGAAQELNRYALEWASKPEFAAWQTDSLYQKAINVRQAAESARREIENRRGYPSSKQNNAELGMFPQRDLAATSAGRVIQAFGRLLRGGVPFLAYFVDAKWSPVRAREKNVHEIESADTSLLTAMIEVLNAYANENAVGEALYSEISGVLGATVNRDSN
ncbi:MAG: hypothetical protein SF162_16610 [bacterium]|nr:hypothetical protein [bacterium]